MNRSAELFDDRYGPGAYQKLATMLAEPCTTFAAIAQHFGVTRERVRQWHLGLCPDAPRGHERKRLCLARRSRQFLLRDPLFRSFYRHVREHLAPGRVALVAARRGLSKRMVRVDGHLVGIRRARANAKGLTVTYRLSGASGAASFVYYRLGETDFLFIPRDRLPRRNAKYRESANSPLDAYRNTFAAVTLGSNGDSGPAASRSAGAFTDSAAGLRLDAWRTGQVK